MGARSAKDLIVYAKAYELAMRIFAISKRFPHEEHCELTARCTEVGKMLGSMVHNPDPFLTPPDS